MSMKPGVPQAVSDEGERPSTPASMPSMKTVQGLVCILLLLCTTLVVATKIPGARFRKLEGPHELDAKKIIAGDGWPTEHVPHNRLTEICIFSQAHHLSTLIHQQTCGKVTGSSITAHLLQTCYPKLQGPVYGE